ncbi:MAG: LysR family transcriptional regulator [Mycobacterium kyogaense]|uniref:LysR family transcriptional regulator n=1 Tax=Mycobacterium kyogaense TaxID=2212479 RepID=UPI002FF5E36F
MFDIRRLVVLAEVAARGSLSAAAGHLNYTTSGVSQQISALERDVGAVLLDRGPNGARLTAAGRRLLDHSEVILSAVAHAERDLEILTAGDEQRLRIASFTSAAATILPPALAHLRSQRPGVEIELLSADPQDAVGLLDTERVDAAVITSVPGERPDLPGLHIVPVYDDEFFVVLPARHRLAGLAELPFSALAADQWVISTATGDCPDVRVFQKACREAGFVPDVAFRADDYTTVQGMVAANMGISLVPSLAVGSARADVLVRRVAGHRPARRISLATSRIPEDGTALATLLSLTRSVGARLSADGVYSDSARPLTVA